MSEQGYRMQKDPTEVLDRRIIAHVIDSLATALGAAAIWWSKAGGIPKLLVDDNGNAVIEESIGENGQTIKRYLVQGSDEPMALSSSDITAVPTWLGDDVYVFQFWGVFVVSLIALSFLMYVVIEGLTGMTLGKAMTGIRTVRASGAKPGIFRAFIRWLMLVTFDGLPLPLVVPLIGFLVALFARGHRRLGELLSGTFVVNKNVAGRAIDVDGSFVVAREADEVATTERSIDRSVATNESTTKDESLLDASDDVEFSDDSSTSLRDEAERSGEDRSPFAPPVAAGVAGGAAGATLLGRGPDDTLDPGDAAVVTEGSDPAGIGMASGAGVDDLDTTADFDTLAHEHSVEDNVVVAGTPDVDQPTTTFETAPPAVELEQSADAGLIDLTSDDQEQTADSADLAADADTREPALVAARTEGAEAGAADATTADAQEQVWVYEPEWDEARQAYIVWDDRRKEWLQYDDAAAEWGPITQ